MIQNIDNGLQIFEFDMKTRGVYKNYEWSDKEIAEL